MEENNALEKAKNTNFVPVLIVVVVLLAAVVIFLLVKPYVSTKELVENEIVTTTGSEVAKEAEEITEPSATPAQTAEPGASPTSTTQPAADHKSDIDKNLVSLDSLDLSTAENDFSDDKLSDL